MEKRLITAILSVVSTPVAAQTVLPAWMTGNWCTAGPRSDRTCEYWTSSDGGIMLGASITTKGGKAAEWEQLRIATVDGSISYIASPGGMPAVAFRVSASTSRSLTFTKPDHDYPQRIRYWRDGAALIAEISLADGSKAKQWRYRRAK